EHADRRMPDRAIGEQGEHHAAHLSGRADHPDHGAVGRIAGSAREIESAGSGHRPVPPYTTASVCSASRPNAEWIARTASSRRASSVTTEMRISEVEIMSMLMPPSPSARNSDAETPGEDFMPAPTSDTLPMSGL